MPNNTLPDWEQVLAEYKSLDPRWCNWRTVEEDSPPGGLALPLVPPDMNDPRYADALGQPG